jgi:hypothetical protein
MYFRRAVDFPVPAIPERNTFAPDWIRSTAAACPGASFIGGSVFGDSPPKELDGLGEETRLGVVWPFEVSHADGCAEFSRDAVRFMVIIA